MVILDFSQPGKSTYNTFNEFFNSRFRQEFVGMEVNKIKKIARIALKVFGINSIIRNRTSHMPRIIMYHGFCKIGTKYMECMPIDQFRKHLCYIKKNFSTFKVSELVSARKLNGFYPEKSVAVTIDDGYEDFYHFALPLLQEYDIPATIFVVTDLVEKNDWMWPDKFQYVMECSRKATNEINSVKSKDLLTNLKNLPVNERNNFLKDIAEQFAVTIPREPPQKFKLMSWNQLYDLTKTGLMEIGSHSCTHPIMSHLNSQESWYEINQSKNKLREKLDLDVTSFCYPNGQIGDYLDNQKEMLKKAGYLCGVASHFGYVSNKSDTYSLPRIVGVKRDFSLFAKFIDGIDYFQKKVKS